jgi:hypothetical protein
MNPVAWIATAGGLGLMVAALFAARRLTNLSPPLTRSELLKRAYVEAANDPAYQAEMAEIDRAFDVTVGDGLKEPRRTGA